MRKLILISTLFLIYNYSNATVFTSIKHGNWEDPTTWDQNAVPSNGDDVVIRVEDTINITNPNLAYTSPMIITLYGGMDFNGGKLVLAGGSSFVIKVGGWVFSTSGNPNNDKVRIDNSGWWTGNDGNQTGYQVWGAALPLSVSYSNLSAEVVDDSYVSIKWIIKKEKHNDYFVVQKSIDGINFENISEIESKESDSNIYAEYKFEDFELVKTAYYRIMSIDVNGNESVSDVMLVRRKTINVSFYPNPTKDYINIENDFEENVPLYVRNCSGQIVKTSKLNNLNNSINIETLTSGIYFIEIIDVKNGVYEKLRVIKE